MGMIARREVWGREPPPTPCHPAGSWGTLVWGPSRGGEADSCRRNWDQQQKGKGCPGWSQKEERGAEETQQGGGWECKKRQRTGWNSVVPPLGGSRPLPLPAILKAVRAGPSDTAALEIQGKESICYGPKGHSWGNWECQRDVMVTGFGT